MKTVMLLSALLCAAVIAAPASAAGYPRSLDIALEDYVTDYAEEEYGFLWEDGDFDCERARFRIYECEIFFDAYASRDVTITDVYGEEVTVMEDDELECWVDAVARKRAAWSRLGRYRVELDDLECEVIEL